MGVASPGGEVEVPTPRGGHVEGLQGQFLSSLRCSCPSAPSTIAPRHPPGSPAPAPESQIPPAIPQHLALHLPLPSLPLRHQGQGQIVTSFGSLSPATLLRATSAAPHPSRGPGTLRWVILGLQPQKCTEIPSPVSLVSSVPALSPLPRPLPAHSSAPRAPPCPSQHPAALCGLPGKADTRIVNTENRQKRQKKKKKRKFTYAK